MVKLMPSTAKWLADIEAAVAPGHVGNLTLPANSIRLGAYYLVRTTERFDGNTVLALAAYNGGPGNVRKWRRRRPFSDVDAFIGAIPFAETRGFIRGVLGNYGAYLSLYPVPGERFGAGRRQ